MGNFKRPSPIKRFMAALIFCCMAAGPGESAWALAELGSTAPKGEAVALTPPAAAGPAPAVESRQPEPQPQKPPGQNTLIIHKKPQAPPPSTEAGKKE